MQSCDASQGSWRWTGLKDRRSNARRRLASLRLPPALIAAASLAVCGCSTQEDLRSYTYEYTDQRHLAAERRASQDMQDSCYFSGAQYFELAGPPQIVTEGGPSDRRFRATQSFYCVGTRGGP